jgi:hypothetical protein
MSRRLAESKHLPTKTVRMAALGHDRGGFDQSGGVATDNIREQLLDLGTQYFWFDN